jgi:putative PIN family toxin of toxin-antitoxin system
LDTCVIVSAFRSRHGASNAVLGLIADRRVVPLVTTALFLEYEAVVKRPEQMDVSGRTIAQLDRALDALASAIEPVEVDFVWRPQLADPDDEMVLDAAVNGRADALITHNIADFAAASKFGLLVLSPGELLRRILL